MRSEFDTKIRLVQNCVLCPIKPCAQAVGMKDCTYDAVGENLCAGAKKHPSQHKPGRDIPSPSLPLYISPVLEATSNDQCHAENLGPWKGSDILFIKASKISKSDYNQVRSLGLHCMKPCVIQLLTGVPRASVKENAVL